jgi:DNA-binding transcriptional LysR family regulator
MNTREMRALIMLAEELHFGRAAQRLGMVQPVLSELIQRVETEAGVTAFVRRPKVAVTDAGAHLIEGTRRALWQIDSSMEQARLVAAGNAGVVRVGLISAALLTPIPYLLRRFAGADPRVHLRLSEAPTGRLLESLDRGEIDLAVTRHSPERSAFKSTHILSDRIELIVPEGHPAAGGPPVQLATLKGEEFVFFGRSAAPLYYDRILQACHAAGLNPTVAQEAESWGATLAMVAAGFGIAIGTSSLRAAAFPGVAFCPVSDAMPDVSYELTYDRARVSPIAAKLTTLLCNDL